MFDDTIAAIATPPGMGGIGIVRLSGKEALPIVQRIFCPHKPGKLRSHQVRYGHVCNPADGTIVDEVLATVMRAPKSFTREDVVELSCHGGPLPLQRTLELMLDAGARLAEPGEFTMRAFLNGRIDLSQAEATLDIIHAQTGTGLALAQSQLHGWLAQEVRRIRTRLLDVLAALTVAIDFPEDEVDPPDVFPDVQECLAAIEHLLATAHHGIIYRQGARAVLVGRPNVGKSSLLNVLLRTNRAIVTPIPGTTRDTLEETANLNGIPVILIDTAGMTESDDPVEQLGVERSREALSGADLALLVFEYAKPISDDDIQIAELTLDKPTILVWNKADLHTERDVASQSLPFTHPSLLESVATSTKDGSGIEAVSDMIAQALVGKESITPGGAHLVTNPRHRDILHRAATTLHTAIESHYAGLPADFMAGDIAVSLHALGEITGETVTDDLLNTIFSRFCIGK